MSERLTSLEPRWAQRDYEIAKQALRRIAGLAAPKAVLAHLGAKLEGES